MPQMVESLLLVATFVLAAAAVVLCVFLLVRSPSGRREDELERRLLEEMRATRKESGETVANAVQLAARTPANCAMSCATCASRAVCAGR